MPSLLRLFLLASLSLSAAVPSALAQNITISGQLSTYPVQVQAHNVGCNGVAPVSFGYSVDDQSAFTAGLSAYDINNTDPNITVGAHTIHFKSWTSSGLCPVLDVPVNISNAPAAPAASSIPANAIAASALLGSSNWKWSHDYGTPGTSIGSSTYPVSKQSQDGLARNFYVSYADHGGEIYHVSFATDTAATHFVYDTYVLLANPSQVGNVEMDMNQVTADGRTMIFGVQCSMFSKTWEFTTVTNGVAHWNKSNLTCNPQSWTANTWHHVQIASHRDQYGNATYDWVSFDGNKGYFSGATGYDSLALGWAVGDLLLNFQLDGASPYSGSMNVYLDRLTIYRW